MIMASTSVAIEASTRKAGRWRFAALAFCIQLVVTIVYSWSVFRIPLGVLHGWSKAQTIAPNRYSFAAVAVGAVVGGWLQDRKGPRVLLSLGGSLVALGSVVSAFGGHSLTVLIIGYGVIGGFGGGAAYVAPIANLIKWFPDQRGRMVGLSVMGSGMSSWFWSPLIEKLIGHDSAAYHETIPRTFLIMGGITFVVIVGLAQLLRDPPNGWQPEGWKPPTVVTQTAHTTVGEMLSTWQFYLLWAILYLGTSVGTTAIGQAAPLIQEVAGKSIPFAIGWAVGIMGACNGVGRLTWGWLSDRFGRKAALFGMAGVSALACLVFLRDASTFGQVLAGLCCAAFAYGGYLALMPSLCADYFGASHIGGNYGLVFSAWGICGFTIPYYSETLLDKARQAGNLAGGYQNLYLQLAGIAVLVGLLCAVLQRPSDASPERAKT